MEGLFHSWRPFIEIAIIWLLLYGMFRLFQGTRAVQVLTGLIALVLLFHLSRVFGLATINWVLTKLFAVGVIAFLIIFQPELRRALARIGQNTIAGGFWEKGGPVDEIVKACEQMSKSRIGALIAIERDIGLKNYIESGVAVDSNVTAELLITIFTPTTPLHDGGVIILGERVAACGSLFPLTQNPLVSKTLGTRHRAAIGLTEETDAVCAVVSEETGAISVAVYGRLTRDLDGEGLRRVLRNLFRPEETENALFKFLRGLKLGKMANK